jgi:hypothetical protein
MMTTENRFEYEVNIVDLHMYALVTVGRSVPSGDLVGSVKFTCFSLVVTYWYYL